MRLGGTEGRPTTVDRLLPLAPWLPPLHPSSLSGHLSAPQCCLSGPKMDSGAAVARLARHKPPSGAPAPFYNPGGPLAYSPLADNKLRERQLFPSPCSTSTSLYICMHHSLVTNDARAPSTSCSACPPRQPPALCVSCQMSKCKKPLPAPCVSRMIEPSRQTRRGPACDRSGQHTTHRRQGGGSCYRAGRAMDTPPSARTDTQVRRGREQERGHRARPTLEGPEAPPNPMGEREEDKEDMPPLQPDLNSRIATYKRRASGSDKHMLRGRAQRAERANRPGPGRSR